MNQILQFPKINARPVPAPEPVAADPVRAELVQEMARHLLAGMTIGLDLSCEFEVIRYLMNTPERYRVRVVTAHMDDAIAEARQTVIGAVMSRQF